MANYWAAQGYDITLLSLSPQSDDWFKLHPRVNRTALGLIGSSTNIGQAIRENVRRITQLRLALRRIQPHVVISFQDTCNIMMLMASWGLDIPVIVSERTDPRRHNIGPAWEALRAVLYRRAAAVVVQTSSIRQWASRLVESKAIYVIQNPVNEVPNGPVTRSNDHGVRHRVVAMGRLERVKGFDLLIQAFARCAASRDSWSLTILGEGRERRNLETLATDLGIADRVSIPGEVRDPVSILKGTDLFVMPSRWEGFPNALLEAMACGLAVIAADCLSGPRDIIHDGMDGVLVPSEDVDALASAMDHLMADHAERQRLGVNAVGVVERFGLEKIMNMWDEVVAHVS
jgi:glycosyltransferase involved in cell wall biosynthesis